MPIDAYFLAGVTKELAPNIIGLGIDKVAQPERDVLLFYLRGKNKKGAKLLVSTGAGDSRIHLSQYKFTMPKEPPMFCMLLRKHFEGARITDISQPQSERVVVISLLKKTSFGDVAEKKLIFEMIGRLSNLILVDGEGKIVDCLRKFSGDKNSYRLVLPGLIYHLPPPPTGKCDPLCITDDEFDELLKKSADVLVHKWIACNFYALSPLICREIVFRAYGDVDIKLSDITDSFQALKREFFDITSFVKKEEFQPWIIKSPDESLLDFSYTHILQYGNKSVPERYDDFSNLLETYFTAASQKNRLKSKSSAIQKLVKTLLDRQKRKIAAQKVELSLTENREIYRQNGDIIMANIHKIKKAQDKLIADDFYDHHNKKREIKLDPSKSAHQNAEKYYKIYKKAKNARIFLAEQISKGNDEVRYLESIMAQISWLKSVDDIDEIGSELKSAGYIKSRIAKDKKGSKNKKTIASTPREFTSSSGFTILIGRNNIQNDKLTFKTASKGDIWLHVKGFHGSHVIVLCKGSSQIDDITLGQAASLAAYYSSACNDSRVQVDYTQVRNVTKKPGSRPGMVTYTNYKTIVAEPKLL